MFLIWKMKGVDQMLPKGLSIACLLRFMYLGHYYSLFVHYKLKE
jgi:hypothetical protein